MTASGISFELRDTKVSVGHVKLGSEVKDFCFLMVLISVYCFNLTGKLVLQ